MKGMIIRHGNRKRWAIALTFDDGPQDPYTGQILDILARYSIKATFFLTGEKIKQNPDWFLIEAENIYKAYIPKFPYKILYTLDKEKIIVWAIAHMHRKPWYWQSRMR